MTRPESLSLGDRIGIVALALLLVAAGGAMLVPAASTPSRTAAPSIGPSLPYREGIVGHPSSINPLTPRTQVDQDLVALLFRGLVRAGPDGEMLPDLADTWTISDDGRTYTFQLSGHDHWEDGEAVTAADVVYTVGLLQDPEYDGPYGSSWQGIHATADGASTVRFVLVLPIGGFLRQAVLPILPQHLLKGVTAADLAGSAYSARPTGDGPYRLVTLDHSHAVLARVPSVVPADSPLPTQAPTAVPSGSSSLAPSTSPARKSSAAPSVSPTPIPTSVPTAIPTPTPKPTRTVGAKGQASLDTIELVFFDDAQSAAAQFQAGKLDAVGGLTPEATNAALALSGSQPVAYRWTSLLAVALNQRVDHPEMRDLRTRTALLEAIDRVGLVKTVLGGAGSTADLPIPRWSSAYDPAAVSPVAYDTAAAMQGLTTTGWRRSGSSWMAPKASTLYALDLLTSDPASNPIMYRTALAVAAAWRQIGLDVTVDAVPAAAYASRLGAGLFVAAVVDFELGLDPDLGPLLLSSQIGSGGSNVSGIADGTLDQLLLTARKTVDPTDRQAAVSAVEKYVSTNQPILSLAFRDYDLVLSRRVQNVSGTEISDPSSRYWDVVDWRLASDG